MWGLRSNSISNRLTVMNMLVSAAALILACAGFFAYDALTFRENLARQTSVQAQMVGANAISALAFDDPRSAQSTLSVLHYSPHVTYAAIYTPSGQLFASYSRDKQTQQTAPPAIPDGKRGIPCVSRKPVCAGTIDRFRGAKAGHGLHPHGHWGTDKAAAAIPFYSADDHAQFVGGCAGGFASLSAIDCDASDRSSDGGAKCVAGKELSDSRARIAKPR